MHSSRSKFLLSTLLRAAVLLLAAVTFPFAPDACAQATGSLTTLRAFNGPTGENPEGALTLGNDGNFYGVAPFGGANNYGSIFRVTAAGTITLIHSFNYSNDGYMPNGQLLLASDGNLYGTTQYGGADYYGTVFRLAPDGTYSILYSFSSDGAHGTRPASGLIQGSDGNLYGTTQYGGAGASSSAQGDGTIFRVTLDGTLTLVHSFNFSQTGTGGYHPASPLVQGSDGSFYGVTAGGGDNGGGVVYRLAPDGTVTTLYSFNGTDGSSPLGPLVEGNHGVFYGITTDGGTAGRGTLFSITSGRTLTTLHPFTSSSEGFGLRSGLVKGADGNLYLTMGNGGSGYGSIVEFTTTGAATTLYRFNGNTDGEYPYGALAQAADGSFYGTTRNGGVSNYGTVFHLIVTPHPPFFNGENDLADGVKYLAFPNGSIFGYYEFLSDPHFIYHFDLGFEYVFDAADGNGGVYFYDFKSSTFFYTSPTFAFPYLYDFTLQTFLYYYPDPTNPQRYNTNGVRYFYNFKTGKIITK